MYSLISLLLLRVESSFIPIFHFYICSTAFAKSGRVFPFPHHSSSCGLILRLSFMSSLTSSLKQFLNTCYVQGMALGSLLSYKIHPQFDYIWKWLFVVCLFSTLTNAWVHKLPCLEFIIIPNCSWLISSFIFHSVVMVVSWLVEWEENTGKVDNHSNSTDFATIMANCFWFVEMDSLLSMVDYRFLFLERSH